MKFNFVGPTIIGLAGVVAPEVFGLPATTWFLGGKQVAFFLCTRNYNTNDKSRY